MKEICFRNLILQGRRCAGGAVFCRTKDVDISTRWIYNEEVDKATSIPEEVMLC